VPNSTPEAAMDELLSKARFVFGEKPWEEWSWEVREFGGRTSTVIRFRLTPSGWQRVSPQP
jgi:hypothetical protein